MTIGLNGMRTPKTWEKKERVLVNGDLVHEDLWLLAQFPKNLAIAIL